MSLGFFKPNEDEINDDSSTDDSIQQTYSRLSYGKKKTSLLDKFRGKKKTNKSVNSDDSNSFSSTGSSSVAAGSGAGAGAEAQGGSASSGSVSVSASTSGDMYLPPLYDLNLNGYKENTKNRLMDHELANNIRNLLPGRDQLFDDWHLVYSMEQHGISLRTLYQNCDPDYQRDLIRRKKAGTQSGGYGDNIVLSMVVKTSHLTQFLHKRHHGYIIVIKDETNAKFGCFINEHLRPMEQKRYYGNGECFLWKVESYDPRKLSHSQERLSEKIKLETRFKAFMYTGINDNIIYSNRDFIAIGSSDGQNGLWIDKSLYTGVSCPCDTFGNEILNNHPSGKTKTGRFKIMGLEVWRIGDYDI